jgi:hypothetical protein
VEEVQPLKKDGEAAAAIPPKLYIRVQTREAMDIALPILAAQKGDSPVLFRVESEGVTLRAPEKYFCRVDGALLAELKGVLGDGNVAVKG